MYSITTDGEAAGHPFRGNQWGHPSHAQMKEEVKWEEGIKQLLALNSSSPKTDTGEEHEKMAKLLGEIGKPETLRIEDVKFINYGATLSAVQERMAHTKRDFTYLHDKLRDGAEVPMPIAVRRLDGTVEILGGNTRVTMAKMHGHETVTAWLFSENDANKRVNALRKAHNSNPNLPKWAHYKMLPVTSDGESAGHPFRGNQYVKGKYGEEKHFTKEGRFSGRHIETGHAVETAKLAHAAHQTKASEAALRASLVAEIHNSEAAHRHAAEMHEKASTLETARVETNVPHSVRSVEGTHFVTFEHVEMPAQLHLAAADYHKKVATTLAGLWQGYGYRYRYGSSKRPTPAREEALLKEAAKYGVYKKHKTLTHDSSITEDGEGKGHAFRGNQYVQMGKRLNDARKGQFPSALNAPAVSATVTAHDKLAKDPYFKDHNTSQLLDKVHESLRDKFNRFAADVVHWIKTGKLPSSMTHDGDIPTPTMPNSANSLTH